MKRLACCAQQSAVEWSCVSGMGLLTSCLTHCLCGSVEWVSWPLSEFVSCSPLLLQIKAPLGGSSWSFTLLRAPRDPSSVLLASEAALSRYTSTPVHSGRQGFASVTYPKGVSPSQTLRWKVGCSILPSTTPCWEDPGVSGAIVLDNAASLLTRKASCDSLHEQSNKEQLTVLLPCLTHIYSLHRENLQNTFSSSENNSSHEI